MRRGAIVLIAAVAVYLYLRPRAVEQEPLRAAQPQAVETSAPARAPVPADEPPAPAAPDAFRGGEIPPALMKEFIVADHNGDGYLTPDEVRGRFPVDRKGFFVGRCRWGRTDFAARTMATAQESAGIEATAVTRHALAAFSSHQGSAPTCPSRWAASTTGNSTRRPRACARVMEISPN